MPASSRSGSRASPVVIGLAAAVALLTLLPILVVLSRAGGGGVAEARD